MSSRRRAFPAAVLVLCLTSCGDGPTNPGTGGGDPIALVIAPGAVLLPAEGATQQLRAYAVDAEGDSTEVDATFESSSPSIVAVTREGLATGGAPIGSAQIVARSGGLTSAPALALRATPAPGALLVDDSQIVGGIEAVDPGAMYQPGWRYRVSLRGTAPQVGQVVLASGGAPIAGRAVSVTPGADGSLVTLELVAIDEMFTELSVDERLSLANVPPAVSAEVANAFQVRREPGNRLRFTPHRGASRWRAGESRQIRNAGRIEQEFELGRFKCKAEVPAPITFPITLDVIDLELSHQLELDLRIEDFELRRFVVSGGIASSLSANPLVTAALEAKSECKTELTTLTLPVWGPLSAIVGGQVPLGVGFELGVKVNLGQVGFDAFIDGSMAAELGVDCPADCSVVGEVTTDADGYFKPVVPSIVEDTRVEMALSAFGWGELAIGNRWLKELQFKTVELKGGLEQKFDLADPRAQVSDAAYRSSFSLKPVIEAKSAANLDSVSALLKINLATFAFAPDLPSIAESPHGSFVITPGNVAPGDGTAPGDMATFTITLANATYLLDYVVESVEIRWLRPGGSGGITLEPGRPGCTTIEAAANQMSFSCATDFLEQHLGEQTFYAFVNASIFGAAVPVLLEVANDAKASVTVETGTATAAVTLINMWGSFDASTQYSGAGQTCSLSEVLEQEFPAQLSRTINKPCSDSYTSPDGRTVTGSGSATGNYQITLSNGALTGITASAGANGSIAEASPPVQYLGGHGEGNAGFGFYFEVHTPVVASLGGGVTLSSPQGEYAYGRAELWSQAGELMAGGQDGPVSGSPTLQPGRYYLYVDAQAAVDNADETRNVTSGASSDVTLTFAP